MASAWPCSSSKTSTVSRGRGARPPRAGYLIDKVIFDTEPGVKVPGLWFTHAKKAEAKVNPTRKLTIYLDDRGMAAQAKPGGAIESLLKSADVLALDLRGLGETAPGV